MYHEKEEKPSEDEISWRALRAKLRGDIKKILVVVNFIFSICSVDTKASFSFSTKDGPRNENFKINDDHVHGADKRQVCKLKIFHHKFNEKLKKSLHYYHDLHCTPKYTWTYFSSISLALPMWYIIHVKNSIMQWKKFIIFKE